MKLASALQINLWLVLLTLANATLPAGAETLRAVPTSPPVDWSVLLGKRKLLVYSSDPRQFKSYVKELCTIRGDNLLRDAPEDHLHHHALMYAIRVNGLNFWEEISGSGVQKSVNLSPPVMSTNAAGIPQATLRQTLYWVAPQDAFLPASPKLALLIEHRTLVLSVDAAHDEVALHWQSQFEVGGKTNTVVLDGSTYFGLGARFLRELDSSARHFNPEGQPDLSGTRQDVSTHDWCAIAFDRPSEPATFVMFSHPENRRGNASFFTMKRPFAYLSATQALHAEPLIYHAGERFQLDYLITVYPTLQSKAFLDDRAGRWRRDKS